MADHGFNVRRKTDTLHHPAESHAGSPEPGYVKKNMERIIEYTADGSATLFVPELNEHYHSVKGALTESSHIFIDMGLRALPAAMGNGRETEI